MMGTDCSDQPGFSPKASDSEMGMVEDSGPMEGIEELGLGANGVSPEVAISQVGRVESYVAVKRESPIDENWGFSGGGAMEEELGDLGFGVPPLLRKQSTNDETVAVKEEEGGEEGVDGLVSPSCSSTVVAPAKPLEGLQEQGPPPFLKKTYHMVEDPSTDSIISWSDARDSFVVWDSFEFSKLLLPKYFKHSNFSSFIRQLNTYGFRKIDCDRWEFANEEFQQGKKHLLKNIKRRSKAPNNKPLVGVSNMTKPGLQTEVETLKKDRNNMRCDIKKLRKQQECALNQIAAVEERVTVAERRQQQILVFLSKAGKNPNFFQQLIHKTKQKRELDSSKKRRLLAGQATDTNQSDEQDSLGNEVLAFPKTHNEKDHIVLPENEKRVLDSCSANYLNWENDDLMAKDDSNQESAGDYSKIFYELKDLIVKPCELGT